MGINIQSLLLVHHSSSASNQTICKGPTQSYHSGMEITVLWKDVKVNNIEKYCSCGAGMSFSVTDSLHSGLLDDVPGNIVGINPPLW